MSVPRVAFFPDSFHEVNGVARTSREFARFAREREYPFFCVHAGPETRHFVENAFETFELRNSRAVLRLQADLSFDLLFMRHRARVLAALSRFQPDLVHITGPNHCGLLGAMVAHELRVPLVASWHTNLHEYAARRLKNAVAWLPGAPRRALGDVAEKWSLALIVRFYALAKLFFAPNPELIAMLSSKVNRPVHLMNRGIDTNLFSPQRRERSDSTFIIGYVGRISPEKNVRLLAELERELIQHGLSNYRFLIVGEGSEAAWLAEHMQRGELPGVLLGEELAKAYAQMDVFVFPSTTDTFGNVILESLASGLPTIVSAGGGPKFLVESGVTGFVADDIPEYARYIKTLHDDPVLRREMSLNARRAASAFSWDEVFERVYQVYGDAIASGLIARSAHSPSARTVLSSIA